MADYFIKADRFFLKSGTAAAGYLEVTDGKFGRYTKEQPLGTILDYSGSWIAPGLVDTHIHGFLGHDVMDNNFDGIREMSKGLLSCGVTSFLPTTLTAAVETLNEVTASIGEHYQEVEGAKIQGIFFEGPFFTAEHKGAQNPSYFSNPNIEVFNHWQKLSHGLIRKIALAPELEGAVEFIQTVTKQGVTVALGHSAASYEQAQAAVLAGASVFVHTYNGMSGLSHREPGMVGGAMNTKETTAELICDGHHVHPAAAEVLITVKTPEKVALITDCMRAGGMPDGEYTLGEFPVDVKDGAARLQSNGSLAGSVLQLFDGVKNVVDWDIATVEEALKMASLVPAQSVHIEDRCGSIEGGLPADFLVISPQIELLETYVDGRSLYKKD
ncbi:N-acetylglucosamine-6-phosphate deacetylase [Enterococcus sp. LJL128]